MNLVDSFIISNTSNPRGKDILNPVMLSLKMENMVLE